MTIDELQWMTKLFEFKNMSKAAEALFISQSALSQCVKRLESQLGFSLFERSNKGLEPTEKGLLLLQAANEITDRYQQFLLQAQLLDRSSLSQIAIGMGPGLSTLCGVDIIHQLHTAYPQIQFSIIESYRNLPPESLRNNTVQLAVAPHSHPVEGTRAHSIGTGQLVIFLRQGSPIAKHIYVENEVPYLDPIHLAEEPLALINSEQATRRLMDALIQEIGFTPWVQQESRHISTLYRYAQMGIASSIVPLSTPAESWDQYDHLICYIPKSYCHATFPVSILALPEIDQIVPKQIYAIIKAIVRKHDDYFKLM